MTPSTPPTFEPPQTQQVGLGAGSATPQGDPYGGLIRNLVSLSPASYYGELPTQRTIRLSILRALGVPEADAEATTLRSFPRGLDPSRILTPGFALGGHIRVA